MSWPAHQHAPDEAAAHPVLDVGRPHGVDDVEQRVAVPVRGALVRPEVEEQAHRAGVAVARGEVQRGHALEGLGSRDVSPAIHAGQLKEHEDVPGHGHSREGVAVGVGAEVGEAALEQELDAREVAALRGGERGVAVQVGAAGGHSAGLEEVPRDPVLFVLLLFVLELKRRVGKHMWCVFKRYV